MEVFIEVDVAREAGRPEIVARFDIYPDRDWAASFPPEESAGDWDVSRFLRRSTTPGDVGANFIGFPPARKRSSIVSNFARPGGGSMPSARPVLHVLLRKQGPRRSLIAPFSRGPPKQLPAVEQTDGETRIRKGPVSR